ncbi:MAG: hypothetical protein QXT45_05060 [Candidatus Bilamarchaeaceae archaeon]
MNELNPRAVLYALLRALEERAAWLIKAAPTHTADGALIKRYAEIAHYWLSEARTQVNYDMQWAGHWATEGLNYYILAVAGAGPSLMQDATEIRADTTRIRLEDLYREPSTEEVWAAGCKNLAYCAAALREEAIAAPEGERASIEAHGAAAYRLLYEAARAIDDDPQSAAAMAADGLGQYILAIVAARSLLTENLRRCSKCGHIFAFRLFWNGFEFLPVQGINDIAHCPNCGPDVLPREMPIIPSG